MKKKHKGALAELKACAWLLQQGWEVFRNISPHGPIDLIAVHPENNEFKLIDVKTISKEWADKGIYGSPKVSPEIGVLGYCSETDTLHPLWNTP